MDDLRYAIDVNTLHREPATELGLNAIGRVRLRTSEPLMLDEYRDSRTTGGFILIDEATSRHRGRGHGRARRSGAAHRGARGHRLTAR